MTTENDGVPEFGDKLPGREYIPRPGAYGLIDAEQGDFMMHTPAPRRVWADL